MLKKAPAVEQIYEEEIIQSDTGRNASDSNPRTRVPRTYSAFKTLVLYNSKSGHKAFAIVRNPESAISSSSWKITMVHHSNHMMSLSIGEKVSIDNEEFLVVGINGSPILSEQEAIQRNERQLVQNRQLTQRKNERDKQHRMEWEQKWKQTASQRLEENNCLKCGRPLRSRDKSEGSIIHTNLNCHTNTTTDSYYYDPYYADFLQQRYNVQQRNFDMI